MKKTKLVAIEITGEETTTHVWRVTIEVPEDMTPDDICELEADIFNHIEQKSEWRIYESEKITFEVLPSCIGAAPFASVPDAIVVEGGDCGYQLISREEFGDIKEHSLKKRNVATVIAFTPHHN